MDAQAWAAAKSVLLHAAELPPDARAAYVSEHCADPAVRAEVLAMLSNPIALSDVIAAPALARGTALAGYVVETLLGAGGMGEVYRARDTRLARDVAIKVLPSGVVHDPDRLQRFAREAQLLAAVAHPHIASVYGLDESQGIHFLVMALVDGPTLAERLRTGPLKAHEALRIAIDVADALKAAHHAGIVHRDLKPANIVLGPNGATLVDFGLARATPRPGAAGPLTTPGTIMGTLPYMAPEQVDGRAADPRTDIFAFGCVLYEMLTGHPAFGGSSAASVGAAILEREPELIDTLAPFAVRRVVKRCLEKSPDARWQTATDLLAELTWIAGTGVTRETGRSWRPRGTFWIPAAVAAAVVAVAALWSFGARVVRHAPALQVVHAEIGVGPAEELSSAISPLVDTPPGGPRAALAWTRDGDSLVFIGRRGGVQQIYVRPLAASAARALPGTERALVLASSPDGQSVAFAAGGSLRVVPLAGGPSSELTSEVDQIPMALVWGSGDHVFFTGNGAVVWDVWPEGRAARVTTLADGELAHIPSCVLPDGRTLLYTIRKREWTWGDEDVVAFDLTTKRRTVLLHDAADARYIGTGHLVFVRRGTLWAVPFDLASQTVGGSATPVIDGIAQALIADRTADATGTGQFSVSATGALAFVTAGPAARGDASLVSVDFSGKTADLGAPTRPYGPTVRVSPDGRRLAVTIGTLRELGLWLYDLGRQGALAPLNRTGEVSWPLWSPDGARIAFKWLRDGRYSVGSQPADGTAPPVALVGGEFTPSSWAPGGRLVGMVGDREIAVAGAGGIALFAQSRTAEGGRRWPEISPDGKWLAYADAGGPGRTEIYAEPYPGPGARVQLSIDGGASPVWHPDGRRVFYVTAGASGRFQMMSVGFVPGTTPRAGQPDVLFEFDPAVLALFCQPVRCFDLAPDGRKFYAVQFHPSRSVRVTHIAVIQNWFEELRTKMGG